MKTYWGNEGRATRILTSAIDGGELSASRSGRFIPGEDSTVSTGHEAG
jgi:hypothetical protein